MSMLERVADTCKQPPGTIRPVVDFNKCEGKADCAAVCPEQVFEVRRIDAVDYARLGLIAKLKMRVHGMQAAYTPRAESCLSCALCVDACPEQAITLKRWPTP